MSDVVFIGPSLPPDEARELLPGAELRPPIRHGDLLRLGPQAGDRVLIVDGLFMQTAPVRHREILAALARGAVVAGSSSMGALRAAELWRHGMRGIGAVFAGYRDGRFDGDDEVAVAYGPAEDGYPLLSRPLVDIRTSLAAAVSAGVLSPAAANRLLAAVRAVPFTARGPAALRRSAAVDPAELDRYLAWDRDHPTDLKGADARRLLAAARAGDLAPAGPADRPIANVGTAMFERWQARQAGVELGGRFVPDAAATGVLRALHPLLPALHRRDTLLALAGGEPAAGALARERGLLTAAGDLDPELRERLAPAERRLPAAEAALRLLVRAAGPSRAGPGGLRSLPAELVRADVLAAARRFARKAMSVNDRLPRPDPQYPRRRLYFRADVIDQLLRGVWDVPGGASEALTAAAQDRGFADLVAARAVVEPFAGLLTLAGPPDFAAAPVPAAAPVAVGT